VYQMCPPLTGADQAVPRPSTPSAPPYDPVIFKSPYTVNDMIGGTPTLNISNSNGRMTGFVVPNITQYLIAYCVKEYRNGVLLSELQREFQINVRTCVSNSIAKFDYTLNNCEDPVTIDFINQSTSPNSTLKSTQWIFNWNGTLSTSFDFNTNLVLNDSGTLVVKLIAESIEGCLDTTEKVIPYRSVKPKLIADSLQICKGETVRLLKSSVIGPIYKWTPSTELSCSNCPDPIASPTTSTWYYLTTDNGDCKRMDSIFVKVNPLAIAKFDYNLNDCEDPVTIDLINQSSIPNSTLKSTRWIFNWNGNLSTSFDFNPKLVLNDSGTLIVRLMAESINGCNDTIEKVIPYQNIIPKLFDDSLQICKGDTVRLVRIFVNGPSYQWSPVTGLSCSNCPDPFANPITSTWYYLITDNMNCKRIDSIFVKINPCIIDSCAVNIREKCLPGGTVELSVEDAFGRLVVPSARDHELFWNLKASATQAPYSIRDKNPIVVPRGTDYSLTSKIYSWKSGSPKTIEYADICQRRIQGKAKLDCSGPCNNIEFILSSCEDTYDMDNNLNFPNAICQSICKNECQFIIALFEKNGNLINPSDYTIKWSNGGTGSYVTLMQPYYNNLTVEVRKGDCIWYGRYIRSCKNNFGSNDKKATSIIEENSNSNSNLQNYSNEYNQASSLISNIGEFSIIPNPINDNTKLIYNGVSLNQEVEIEFWHSSGKFIGELKSKLDAYKEIDLRTEYFKQTGIYFVKIKSQGKQQVIRIMVL
ncbi:MAG: T9SS type A sorting domain-containing protein, partial [Saprospiraceae bacterium]